MGWVKGKPVRFLRGHGTRGERHPFLGKKGADHPAFGNTNRGAWKGGITITSQGYRLRNLPRDHRFACMAQRGASSCYVSEHRLVMAEAIGRPLTRREIVHHIDGDKLNNRIENLLLFSSQKEHIRHHEEEERKAVETIRRIASTLPAHEGRELIAALGAIKRR